MYFYITEFMSIKATDKATLLVSLFSFTATLSAPVIAFLFYDSWKSQTKFNRVTNNIIELQKILHDFASSLKGLRQRIIFPHTRNKFNGIEEDYTNILKKLFDKKMEEINEAEKLKYQAIKILSIIKSDTFKNKHDLQGHIDGLNNIILDINQEINLFTHQFIIFINHYYKNECDLKLFLKTNEYKQLTYKISAKRELSNAIKNNLDLYQTLDEDSINPQITSKIHRLIERTDQTITLLLIKYEQKF